MLGSTAGGKCFLVQWGPGGRGRGQDGCDAIGRHAVDGKGAKAGVAHHTVLDDAVDRQEGRVEDLKGQEQKARRGTKMSEGVKLGGSAMPKAGG